jgi:hypothetical protein
MQYDLDQTRLAMAALAACIVRTLDEGDGAVLTRFEGFLQQAYNRLRDPPADHKVAAETLRLTKEFLHDR